MRELGLTGALVLEVLPGSPAQLGGLRPTRPTASGDLELGDVIIAIDGSPIRSREDLAKALDGLRAGERARVTLLREGVEREFDIAVALESH